MTQQLANYLRQLREAKGYSTRQLAARTGWSQTHISAVETGVRLPSLVRLWEIVTVLEGDFPRALFYLCLDLGIPEEAVKGIYQNKNQDK